MAQKTRDITGLKVGKLTAKYIYKQSGKSGNQTLWYCECECGGSIVKPLSDLVRTSYSSCGCDKTKPAARKDHTGKRYGCVIGLEPTDKIVNSQVVWKWKCDCGKEFENVAGNYVYKGSEGCPDCTKEKAAIKIGDRKRKHGMSRTKEFAAWSRIKYRCFNPASDDYKDYGAKGIIVSPLWEDDFEAFLSHIGPCPKDGKKYSVDRIDCKGNYEPGNVRWATDEQQARNKGKAVNNTSGVTGVHIETKLHKNKINSTTYAVTQWRDLDGKVCKASYSFKKYGEELAFFLACEKRDLEIMKLNLLGAGYSDNHGK